MVFVDARTGHVYNPPLAIGRMGDQRIGLPMFQGGIAEVEYRLTSRLFKMNACPGEPSRLSLRQTQNDTVASAVLATIRGRNDRMSIAW